MRKLKIQLVGLCLISIAASCSTVQESNNTRPIQFTDIEQTSSIEDIPQPNNQGGLTDTIESRQEEINAGTNTYFSRPLITETTITATTSNSGENFIFRSADIGIVVNEVFTSFALNYVISPNVRGTMSLRLEGIQSAEDAVSGLNSALGLQGYEITRDGSTYLIGRKGEAQFAETDIALLSPQTPIPTSATIAILQLKYAKLEDILPIAQPLLPAGLIKGSDEARGFIMLQGEASQVSGAIKILRALDVNWFEAVSTAILPVNALAPSDMAAELEPVLNRLGGVSIIPMDRLQAMIVFARNDDLLETARSWLQRLDKRAEPQLENDVLVYEARYSDAEILASIANASNSGYRQDQSYNSSGQEFSQSERQTSRTSTQEFSDGVLVNIDPARNAIVARGSREELIALRQLFEVLDQPQRQVIIEATIVEVALTEDNQLGVQWRAVEDKLSAAFSDTASSAPTSLFPGVSVSYTNVGIDAVVNALASTSDVEIVSAPRIMVLNNETARLQVGDQVPVITQSAVSITDPGAPVVNSTSYRDTGVILTVTPSIRAGGVIVLEISQEVSGVAETTTSNIDSPTITQRSIDSKLAVKDGATAVLGGLLSNTASQSETGLPYLKDAPVIGRLFKSAGQNKRRTELVVLISPTIVLSDEIIEDMPQLLRDALLKARNP